MDAVFELLIIGDLRTIGLSDLLLGNQGKGQLGTKKMKKIKSKIWVRLNYYSLAPSSGVCVLRDSPRCLLHLNLKHPDYDVPHRASGVPGDIAPLVSPYLGRKYHQFSILACHS